MSNYQYNMAALRMLNIKAGPYKAPNKAQTIMQTPGSSQLSY